MITVISGTGRSDSRSMQVATFYQNLLSASCDMQVKLLSLEGKNVWERGPELLDLEQEFLLSATHFAFIVPEYNGSYPGLLKTMIDNTNITQIWHNKKALLTGIADGRAGNLRGLDHLTAVLQYLKVHVYHDRLPISRIADELDTEGRLFRKGTAAAVALQIQGFMQF